MRKPLAIGVAAAIALGSISSIGVPGPAVAAPVNSSALALKEAVPDNVVDVHKRWRRHRGAAVAGLALGIIGSIIAREAYRKRHRRHYYYEPYPYAYPHCIRRHGLVYCR